MEATDLFTGISVVIDDKIGEKDKINDLIDQIEAKKIPVVKYNELPEESMVEYFSDISFLLLDWNLWQKDIPEEEILKGVKGAADTIEQSGIEENIIFLKKFKETCFAPVFIFTNEDKERILSVLRDNDLYKDDKPNFIFVKNKSELTGRTRFFREIEKWLKKIPSIYVLKAWEKEYRNAKNELFWDFYDLSPSWPQILWESFKADGINMSKELGEVITRNLYTRMAPFSFDDNILSRRGKKTPKKEIRRVLEGERFVNNDKLVGDAIDTGDMFREEYQENGETKYRYYLNIRPQCDLARSSNLDKTELYCLRGRIVDSNKINRKTGVRFEEGQFIEKINNAFVACIDSGKIIEFKFRDLKIIKWKDLKGTRIGRLLPPYITRIQQRYALYLHRQGLPRTPEKAVLGS